VLVQCAKILLLAAEGISNTEISERLGISRPTVIAWRRRRGDFASVEELGAAIGRFCHAWNQRCQPFVWVTDAEEILARFTRHQTPPGR
jgi:hypothetical protein